MNNKNKKAKIEKVAKSAKLQAVLEKIKKNQHNRKVKQVVEKYTQNGRNKRLHTSQPLRPTSHGKIETHSQYKQEAMRQRVTGRNGRQNVLQGPSGYKEAMTFPGRSCVLPPLGSVTGVDSAIPLALQNNYYIEDAFSDLNNKVTLLDCATHPYLVIGLCPIATMFGVDVNGQIKSGLTVNQLSNLSIQFDCKNVFDPMGQYPTDKGMIEVYGTDCTNIGQGGNIFSMGVDVTIQTSDANQSHECYIGTIPMGSLIDEEGKVLACTYKQLMQGGVKQTSHSSYKMRNFIRNPASLVEYHRNGADISLGTIAQEMYTYMIIVRPIRIINTGTAVTQTSAPYTIGMHIGSNWIVWPKPDPASKSLSLCTTETVNFNAYKTNVAPMLNSSSQKGFSAKWVNSGDGILGDAWNFLKSMDMQDWGWLAAKVGAMLLKKEPSYYIQPASIVYNLDKLKRWLDEFACPDPKYSQRFVDLRDQLNSLYEEFSNMQPYNYPPIKYLEPKLCIGITLHETWDLLRMHKHEIPRMDYIPGIGFVCASVDADDREWFNEFEMLMDESKMLIKCL